MQSTSERNIDAFSHALKTVAVAQSGMTAVARKTHLTGYPLKKGGCDRPVNMQWQTKEAAKEKDEME